MSSTISTWYSMQHAMMRWMRCGVGWRSTADWRGQVGGLATTGPRGGIGYLSTAGAGHRAGQGAGQGGGWAHTFPEWKVARPAALAASAIVVSERGSALVSAVQMQSRFECRPVSSAPRDGEHTFIASTNSGRVLAGMSAEPSGHNQNGGSEVTEKVKRKRRKRRRRRRKEKD